MDNNPDGSDEDGGQGTYTVEVEQTFKRVYIWTGEASSQEDATDTALELGDHDAAKLLDLETPMRYLGEHSMPIEVTWPMEHSGGPCVCATAEGHDGRCLGPYCYCH